jgi:uncharacterized damage-inducible protein DinB
MNAADLRRLYDYTDWANERLLGAIAELSEEQFTRPIVSSFSSIRDTLSHIAFAEWIWLERWKGSSPSEYPAWTKESSFAALRDRLHAIAADRNAYLDRFTDDMAASTIDYRSMKGDPFTMPLGELLFHCANHSTYHRGQLVTMLRQAGATAVPSTDYSQFLRS